jgi:hypothetical protein
LSQQAKQSIAHTAVTFYGDYMKMCKDFAANFGDKRTGRCVTTTDPHTSFFTRESFTKINMAVVLHPPYFSPFPRLKLKLKGHHFDTIEVIDAELLAVLNALTESDLQDAFKTWQKRWERCIRAEGDYFEGDGGQ